MNPDIKKLWVNALRSGKYTQDIDVLSCNGRFCVLGVLCDIHAKNHNGIWTLDEEENRKEYLGKHNSIPDEVGEWAALSPGFGSFVEINGERNSLARHNDAGHTFEELANAIEEQL